jgi:hypothetical protein
MYNLAEWAKVPRRLTTGGRAVRLDGYQRQPVSTLQVLGANGGDRILLLVIPPHSEPGAAHDAMMTAAAPGNASTVNDLLAASAHVL